MRRFERLRPEDATVQYLCSLVDHLDFDPPYQREGGVWTRARQQLFIDSLINGFDVPKLYFKRVDGTRVIDGERRYIRYEIVDGKQRMMAMIDFLRGEYPLSDDFVYLADKKQSSDIAGKNVQDLRELQPSRYIDLMGYVLDVIVLNEDDDEEVDAFFVRLNEGVPLNAQEKRNGRYSTSLVARCVRELAGGEPGHEGDPFVTKCLPKRDRGKTDELVARCLSVVDQWRRNERLGSVGRYAIDQLYRRSAEGELGEEDTEALVRKARDVFGVLSTVFSDAERAGTLLDRVGNVPVYFYAAFRERELWGNPNVAEWLLRLEDEAAWLRTVSFERLSGDELRRFQMLDDYVSARRHTTDGSKIMLRKDVITCYLKAQGDVDKAARAYASLKD